MPAENSAGERAMKAELFKDRNNKQCWGLLPKEKTLTPLVLPILLYVAVPLRYVRDKSATIKTMFLF